ncbi:hypothetical protein M569_10152, partial [Genlisea aurea]
SMVVPPWLERLLNTGFFHACEIHASFAKSECNMFCLDCNSDPFCFYCRNSSHADHQVIQIRRSSYHDVVRVSEIQKVLDVSEVQTYVINSAKVLFLNERPQPKGGKTASHVCEICARSLLATFRFCSLGCKLVGIKGNANERFLRGEGTSSKEEDEGSSQSGHDFSLPPPPLPPRSPSTPRRRKGIPRRAPFRS